MRNKIVTEDLEYITNQDLDWEQFKDSTVLISGASGFLPAYMVETFMYLNETKGLNIRVICLVRNVESSFGRFSNYLGKNIMYLFQDVCEKVKLEEDIDYIIHAASPASPKLFLDRPVDVILPNTLGTINLLELAVEKSVKGFLYFSTSGVCFDGCNPTELSSCYIESKRMGENACIAYEQQYGVPVKIVRPSHTYGYGVKLDDGRSFADFIKNILHNENIVLYSDGSVLRNFCYIADAVVGFFMVMLKGEYAKAYVVANEKSTSIVDLAHLLVEKAFPELKLKVINNVDSTKKYLRMDFPNTTVDVSDMKNLGWNMNFSLEEGFRRTILIYREELK
jgi:UDP-glucuronate decarboxylase